MSIWNKLGLVESNDEMTMDMPELSTIAEEYLPEVNVDTTNVVTPEEIYSAAYLTDLSKSIFKVDEIKKVLPASMTEETKKQSVIGMMAVSNITVEEVVNDANARIEAILATLEKSTNETKAIIDDGEEQIRQHEAEIEALKAQIEERKKTQEEQNKIINAELEKVNTIKGFIL